MKNPYMMYNTGTVLWVLGFGLVILSWLNVVSSAIGWGGCGVSVIGAGMQYFARKQL